MEANGHVEEVGAVSRPWLFSRQVPKEIAQIRAEFVFITPQMATEMLANAARNREITRGRVNAYSADHRAGKFPPYHPVGINEDGQTFDGQHRLTTIIETGIGMWCLVLSNVPNETAKYVDQGFNRNDLNVAHIVLGKKLSSNQASVAKRMYVGASRFRPTRSQRLAFFERHQEALEFVFARVTRNQKGITQGPVLAPIARAWYSEDRDRLSEYCECLLSGEASGENQAVIPLRNYVTQNISGTIYQHQLYLKSENALRHFLDRRPLNRLVEAKGELWPLPEEIEAVQ